MYKSLIFIEEQTWMKKGSDCLMFRCALTMAQRCVNL